MLLVQNKKIRQRKKKKDFKSQKIYILRIWTNLSQKYEIKNKRTFCHAHSTYDCLLQVVQLQELFEVRHSVFIVGSAGTGKTGVWKSLFKANQVKNNAIKLLNLAAD